MVSFSSHDAAQAIQILLTAAIDRRNALEEYGDKRPEDSDEDNGTDALILDRFYEERGAKAVNEITKFSLAQLIGIRAGFETLIIEHCNVERGQ